MALKTLERVEEGLNRVIREELKTGTDESIFDQLDKQYRMKTNEDLKTGIEDTVRHYTGWGFLVGFVAGAAGAGYVANEAMNWLGPDAPAAVRYAVDGLVGILTGRYLTGPTGAMDSMNLGIAKVKKVLAREE